MNKSKVAEQQIAFVQKQAGAGGSVEDTSEGRDPYGLAPEARRQRSIAPRRENSAAIAVATRVGTRPGIAAKITRPVNRSPVRARRGCPTD